MILLTGSCCTNLFGQHFSPWWFVPSAVAVVVILLVLWWKR